RPALGWRAAAVPARPPRAGRPDPGRRRGGARPGGRRGGVRGRRDPRGDRVRPPSSGPGHRPRLTAPSRPPTFPAEDNGGMANSKVARVKEINESIRYTMWSVFRLEEVLGEDSDRTAEGQEVEKLFAELAESDVVVR